MGKKKRKTAQQDPQGSTKRQSTGTDTKGKKPRPQPPSLISPEESASRQQTTLKAMKAWLKSNGDDGVAVERASELATHMWLAGGFDETFVEHLAISLGEDLAEVVEDNEGEGITEELMEQYLETEWGNVVACANCKAQTKYATELFYAGDVKGGKAAIVEALEIYPESVSARIALAHIVRFTAESADDLESAEALLYDALTSAEETTMRCEAESVTDAVRSLGLLLCQEGKDDEAKELLAENNFLYRLAPGVLNYGVPNHGHKGKGAAKDGDSGKYVAAVDNFLSKDMFEGLLKAFQPNGQFWSDHNYNSETSSYFSYTHKLGVVENLMDEMVHMVWDEVKKQFPSAANATYAEWWSHCRPHPSGHQMHFDSDNEGIGGIRNPIATTVTYLTEGIGGPTLVTTQTITDNRLAEKGWLVHPHENRLTMLVGNVLHGVVPGRGVCSDSNKRRVTLMISFWEDIKEADRSSTEPGAAIPYPRNDDDGIYRLHKWPRILEGRRDYPKNVDILPAPCTAVDQIWTDVDEKGNKKAMVNVKKLTYLPGYDACFQGF